MQQIRVTIVQHCILYAYSTVPYGRVLLLLLSTGVLFYRYSPLDFSKILRTVVLVCSIGVLRVEWSTLLAGNIFSLLLDE